jgi:glycerol-3-phosphate dehydrogenase
VERDLTALAEREFDVVVVGGGIAGICTAWDAASRGFSVALLERQDFVSGASANCLKIVHSGVRHMQRFDLGQVRATSRERATLFRIAPHQVRPLPMLLPAYGHGLRGPELLAAGVRAYDLLTSDHNRSVSDADHLLPRGRRLAAREVVDLAPQIATRGLTGGMLFYEAQMESPVRLAFSFLHAAVDAGARVANYTEATVLRRRGERVEGVEVTDRLGGETFPVRGRIVVDAAGGCAALLRGGPSPRSLRFTRDICLVISRPPPTHHAVAVVTPDRARAAGLHRGGRHLILAPWRNRLLAGAWHRPLADDEVIAPVTEAEVHGLVTQLNEACPGLGLSLEEVALCQTGAVLASCARNGAMTRGRSAIIDHAEHGVHGLITLVTRLYTMARLDAERTVDLVCAKLSRTLPPTTLRPIFGGALDGVESYRRSALEERPDGVSEVAIEGLVRRYGSAHRRVLRHALHDPAMARRLGDSDVLAAEVAFAVREEMAQTLDDVVFRRTELGTGGHPGEALGEAAAAMAQLLGWSGERMRAEMEQVKRHFFRPAANAAAA